MAASGITLPLSRHGGPARAAAVRLTRTVSVLNERHLSPVFPTYMDCSGVWSDNPDGTSERDAPLEIVVKGRKAEVTERFRKHVVDKLSRIERYDHKIISLDVELSKERTPRQPERKYRIDPRMPTPRPATRP